MAVMSSNGKASIDAIASENGWIKENETVCPSWQSRKICCLTSSKSICTSGFQPRNRPSNPAQIYIELIYEICITYVKTNPAPCLQNTEKKSWPCASWGRSSDIACYAKLWQQLRPMMINWSDSPITNFLITLSYCSQIKDSKMRTNTVVFNSLGISSRDVLGHLTWW